MKYGKIYTYENRNEAELGKRYVFSDCYKNICSEELPIMIHSKLVKVEDCAYPFKNEDYGDFQFIREIIDEPALMTHRQLSEWLAKGNGQYKCDDSLVWPYNAYSQGKENETVNKCIRIRRWDSDEWVVPTVGIYERDCR